MPSRHVDAEAAGRVYIPHLSDRVILLQYQRADTRLRRTITVLKSRASAHDPQIRELDITADGIVLEEPIARD